MLASMDIHSAVPCDCLHFRFLSRAVTIDRSKHRGDFEERMIRSIAIGMLMASLSVVFFTAGLAQMEEFESRLQEKGD